MRKIILVLVLLVTSFLFANSQIVEPFTVYKQLTQRGDITFAANTILTCGTGTAACNTARTNPPPGSGTPPAGPTIAGNNALNNNAYNPMSYVDADGTPTFGGLVSFSSSRSFLDLSNNPGCSVIEAYLTWGGNITTGTTNYAKRDSVYVKAPGAATTYTGFKADFITNNTVGATTYQCYKNITNLIRASGEGNYWVANVVAQTGAANLCSGWAIVVIYGDETLPLRNLTIYKGYANISAASGAQTLPISGFFTPPGSAPVNVKLGVFAFEGDQGNIGDSLKFNGVGTNYLPVTDALNYQDNFFNSSIDIGGVSINAATSTNPGNPTYVNSLGFDADIITLNNATKTFLGNGAGSANIRLTTGGDQYWPFMLTTAIDVFEPNVVVTKDWIDDNGGLVELGDVITYNLKVRNKGTDPATNVELVDSLYGAMDYVAGSSRILTGPNTGLKTDAIGDDQVDVNGSVIKFRLGSGANGTNGGSMGITAATDSVTTITFKVQITNDCQIFHCRDSVLNKAYVNFNGFTSGQGRSTLSSPNGLDPFGCPIQGPTILRVNAPVCTTPLDTTFSNCVPYNLSTLIPYRPGYTQFFNNSWTPVTQATATGTYYALRELYPGCNDTVQVNFTQVCILPILLVDFTASYQNKQVLINWKTATETNNKEFVIERSIDGIRFEKIATVPGAINSNDTKLYNFTDNTFPKVNKLYYRLVQVDLNGSIKYSATRLIILPIDDMKIGIDITKVMPNPVKDVVYINVASSNDNSVIVKIVDVQGKMINTFEKSVKKGDNNLQFNLSSFAKGLYFFEFINTDDGKKVTAKILKQ
jgi:uncharacterized repeat protein (TIGR01451 family)